MKNQIAALAGKVVELNKMVESWKNKYQKSVEECDNIQKQLDDVRKENRKLSNDNQRLQETSADMTEWCVFWEQKLWRLWYSRTLKNKMHWKKNVEWSKCQREAF